jgi:hypothetical protein
MSKINFTNPAQKLIKNLTAVCEAMPEQPGVVALFSEDGVLLTLSATDNLRDRALTCHLVDLKYIIKHGTMSNDSGSSKKIKAILPQTGGNVVFQYFETSSHASAKTLKKQLLPSALCY